MKNIWKSSIAGVAAIILLTIVAYIPAMRGGFVFDDDPLIVHNPLLHASDGLHRFWFTTQATDYYPLTWSLLWVEWRLWGASAAGYHVLNVLLHAVNAILVWAILRRLKIPGAWLAGLVFAVHPLNAATVAWISEQKNTLSMLFFAVAILLYLRFDETNDRRWYAVSLTAFLLALFSKTAVVMLPVVLLGCVWWQRGRIQGKDWLRSLPFFALSLASGLTTIWIQHNRDLATHAVRVVGFPFRLAAAGWVPWFYVYKALLPFNLSVIYPQWNIDVSRWVCWLPGALLMGCLALFWWKRTTWGRPLLFATGYFVVTLFPVLGFFDQGFYQYSLVADHWQYYSIIAPIALVIAAGQLICSRRREWGRACGAGAAIVLLLALGMATWTRASVYGSAETLWRDTVDKNPNAWVAHNNLGVALARLGRVQEAVGHYEQAVRLEPRFADAHYNLGNALVALGRTTEAVTQFQEALRIKPGYAEAHYNLGVILERLGRVSEAIPHYAQALKLRPDLTVARNALARLGADR